VGSFKSIGEIVKKLIKNAEHLRRSHVIKTSEFPTVYFSSDIHADFRKYVQMLQAIKLVGSNIDPYEGDIYDPSIISEVTWTGGSGVLLIIIGDLVDGKRGTNGMVDDPRGSFEFLLLSYLHNLRIQANKVKSEILYTIGNHEYMTLLLPPDPFAEVFYDYIHPSAITFFSGGPHGSTEYESILFRADVLNYFYLSNPFFMLSFMNGSNKEMACIHGGFQDVLKDNTNDIENLQSEIDSIHKTEDVFEKLRDDTLLIINRKNFNFGGLFTRFYASGNTCDKIKSSYPFIVVGHCPTNLFSRPRDIMKSDPTKYGKCDVGDIEGKGVGCVVTDCLTHDGPKLAFVDTHLSQAFRSPDNLYTNPHKRRYAQFLKLSHIDGSSKRFYNKIESVLSDPEMTTTILYQAPTIASSSASASSTTTASSSASSTTTASSSSSSASSIIPASVKPSYLLLRDLIVQGENIEKINELLTKTPELLNMQTKFDFDSFRRVTPLHVAAALDNNGAVINALLLKGANPLLKTSDGKTPLMIATIKGYLSNVQELLSSTHCSNSSATSCGIDEQEDTGLTAVYYAVEYNKPEILSFLLKQGASRTLNERQILTPLILATQRELYSIIEILLQDATQEYIDYADPNFNTALHYAAFNDCNIAAYLLLQKGATPDLKNKKGVTPLMMATKNKNTAIQSLLTERDPAKRNEIFQMSQMWQKLYDDSRTISPKPLGRGGFGVTRKVIKNAKNYAIKRVLFDEITENLPEKNKQNDFQSTSSRSGVRKEIDGMMKVSSSPYVIPLRAYEFHKRNAYIVMDLQEGTDLYDAIIDNLLTDKTIKKTIHDLLKGLADIHSRGILHLDIKPENIFYSPKDGGCKYFDFGLWCDYPCPLQPTAKGTRHYHKTQKMTSSEGQTLYKYDKTSDFYSLSVVLSRIQTDGNKFLNPTSLKLLKETETKLLSLKDNGNSEDVIKKIPGLSPPLPCDNSLNNWNNLPRGAASCAIQRRNTKKRARKSRHRKQRTHRRRS